ncbi:MAG TPA: hypothetical protein PKI14_01580 [Fervidobacterium sp.]|nr:hypothetical protein [Fervidobacterium sp.]
MKWFYKTDKVLPGYIFNFGILYREKETFGVFTGIVVSLYKKKYKLGLMEKL